MRYVFTADWHIKDDSQMDRAIGNKYFDDKFNILASIIDFSKNKRTTLFILGDVFDCPNPSIKERIAFHELMDHAQDVEVCILYGNHDYEKNGLNFFKETKWFRHNKIYLYEKARSLGLFDIIPWSDRGSLHSSGHAKILLGHQSIKGFRMSEVSKCKVGYDQQDKLFKRYEYSIFGHFHIPDERNNIYYCGSPYPITFGETSRAKRILYYDEATEKLSVVYINKIVKGPTLDFVNYHMYNDNDVSVVKQETEISKVDYSGCIVRLKYNPYTVARKRIDDLARYLTDDKKPYFIDIVPEGGLSKLGNGPVNENISGLGFAKSFSKYMKTNWKSKKLRKKALKVLSGVEDDNVKGT